MDPIVSTLKNPSPANRNIASEITTRRCRPEFRGIVEARSPRQPWLYVFAFSALLGFGCGRPQVTESPVIPTVIVQDVRTAGGMTEEWSGFVRAPENSSLAFSVAGRIRRIVVEVGDAVTAGALLAELDPEPFRLQLEQAQAEAATASPALAEATRRRDSEERLWRGGASSCAEYDAAVSAYAAARGRADTAAAALALAQRDLRESSLVAPTAGRIAQRFSPAATVVAAGTPVLAFDPAGTPEVMLAIPSSRLGEFSVGSELQVRCRLAESAPAIVPGRITHISQRSLAGGVHEVLVRLPESTRVFSGEAVTARLLENHGSAGVAISTTAVQPLPASNTGVVWVLDPRTNVVRRREVQFGNFHGGEVIVQHGLGLGETIVATGWSFLRDGQQVQPRHRE